MQHEQQFFSFPAFPNSTSSSLLSTCQQATFLIPMMLSVEVKIMVPQLCFVSIHFLQQPSCTSLPIPTLLLFVISQ
jgi:hypothetical protein